MLFRSLYAYKRPAARPTGQFGFSHRAPLRHLPQSGVDVSWNSHSPYAFCYAFSSYHRGCYQYDYKSTTITGDWTTQDNTRVAPVSTQAAAYGAQGTLVSLVPETPTGTRVGVMRFFTSSASKPLPVDGMKWYLDLPFDPDLFELRIGGGAAHMYIVSSAEITGALVIVYNDNKEVVMLARLNPRTLRASGAANVLTRDMLNRMQTPIRFASSVVGDKVVAVLDWTAPTDLTIKTDPTTRVVFIYASGDVRICAASIREKLAVPNRATDDPTVDDFGLTCSGLGSATETLKASDDVPVTPTAAVIDASSGTIYIGTDQGDIVTLRFSVTAGAVTYTMNPVRSLRTVCPVSALAVHPSGTMITVACADTGTLLQVRVLTNTDFTRLYLRSDQTVGSMVHVAVNPTRDYRAADAVDLSNASDSNAVRSYSRATDFARIISMSYTQHGAYLAVIGALKPSETPVMQFLRSVDETPATVAIDNVKRGALATWTLSFSLQSFPRPASSVMCTIWGPQSSSFTSVASVKVVSVPASTTGVVANITNSLNTLKFIITSGVTSVAGVWQVTVINATNPSIEASNELQPTIACSHSITPINPTAKTWSSTGAVTPTWSGPALPAATYTEMVRSAPQPFTTNPFPWKLQLATASTRVPVVYWPAFSTEPLALLDESALAKTQSYRVQIRLENGFAAPCTINNGFEVIASMVTNNGLSESIAIFCTQATIVTNPIRIELTPWVGSLALGHASDRSFLLDVALHVRPTFKLVATVTIGSTIDSAPIAYAAGTDIDIRLLFDVPLLESSIATLSVSHTLAGCTYVRAVNHTGAALVTISVPISMPADAALIQGNSLLIARMSCTTPVGTGLVAKLAMLADQGFVATQLPARLITGNIFSVSLMPIPFEFEVTGTPQARIVTLNAQPKFASARPVIAELLRNSLPLRVPCTLSFGAYSRVRSVSVSLLTSVNITMDCTEAIAPTENVVLALSYPANDGSYNIINSPVVAWLTSSLRLIRAYSPLASSYSIIHVLTPLYVEVFVSAHIERFTSNIFRHSAGSVCAFGFAEDLVAVDAIRSETDFANALALGLLSESLIYRFSLSSAEQRRHAVLFMCTSAAALAGSVAITMTRYAESYLYPPRLLTHPDTFHVTLEPRAQVYDPTRGPIALTGNAFSEPVSHEYFFDNLPVALRLEWTLPTVRSVSAFVTLDYVDIGPCFFNGDITMTSIVVEVLVTDDASGSLDFLFTCSAMRPSEVLQTQVTVDGTVGETWHVQRLRFTGRTTLTATMTNDTLDLSKPALTVEFPLKSVTPVHFAFSPPLPAAAVLQLSFSNPTAECIFVNDNATTSYVALAANTGMYNLNIKCNFPASIPPQIIAKFAANSSVYYQEFSSSALQTKGNLVFTIDGTSIESYSKLIAGQVYKVVAQFLPPPKAMQTVEITQLTSPSDCVFQLRGTGRYISKPIFVQKGTSENFTANMVCRRTHNVGSHVFINSNAYSGSSIGPVPVFGLMGFDFVMPTNIVGVDREITDLVSRSTLELVALQSGAAALSSPYYLRAPNTNITGVRLRMIPTVRTMTIARIRFASTEGECGFTVYSPSGVPSFTSTTSVTFVLGDAAQTVYVSCTHTTVLPVTLLAEVVEGDLHLPVLSVPLHVRGSVLFSTQQINPAVAFTGEIVANRDWVFTMALEPKAVDVTTFVVSVLANSVTGPQPKCAFRLFSNAVAYQNLSYGAFEFTFDAAMLAVDLVISCSVETKLNPAVIVITNAKDDLYDTFRSAPFSVRGAIWIEDALLERTVTFPPLSAPTTLDRVAVERIHSVRVRLMPAPTASSAFVITPSLASCKVALSSITIISQFKASLSFSVAAGAAEFMFSLYCSSANPSVQLTIVNNAAVFFGQFTTAPFAVENRFDIPTLPGAIHAQEPQLITVSFLPQNAVNAVGRSIQVAITVDSKYANCFGARLNTITGGEPDPSTWVSLSNDILELTVVYALRFDFWFKCMTFTHSYHDGLAAGAAVPRIVVHSIAGIAFMSFTSDPISITLIDCFPFATTVHGRATYHDNGFGITHYKSDAYVSCDAGYELLVTDNTNKTCIVNTLTTPPVTTCTQRMTCLATGWSALPPTCEIFNCGPVPERYPTFGTEPVQIELAPEGNSTSFGSRYLYGCVDGFDLSGSPDIFCTAGGWSATTAPSCVPIECPVLVTANNVGNITYSALPYGTRKFQSVATHECLARHIRTEGDEVRVCQANRTWSGTAPTCRSNTCVSLYNEPTMMKNIVFTRYGSVVPHNPVTNTFLVDTIAQYTCADGYIWDKDTTFTTRTCILSDGWQPVDAPRCVPQPCPTLTPVDLGSVTQAPQNLVNMYGVTASFSCQYGAIMSHSDPHITCTATGEWSSPPRTCFPFSCGVPENIAFAQVSVANSGTYGRLGMYLNTSTVEYRCNVGYNLHYDGYTLTDGTGYVVQFAQQNSFVLGARRECTPRGWFPFSLPVCDVNQCIPLEPPRNGASIVFDDALSTSNGGLIARSYGTTATYVCKSGYEPRDPVTDALTSSKRRCGTLSEGWIPAIAPVCGAIDCGRPDKDSTVAYSEPIEFEYDELVVAGPTRYQSTAIYRCKPGFTPSTGQDRFLRTCSAAAVWLPAPPTCVDIDECDPGLFNGKYFADCAALYGPYSRCINTFGSYVCTPHMTLDILPESVASPDGSVSYNAETREVTPNNARGNQTVVFTLNAGINVAAPFVTHVQYLNTNMTLYPNPNIATYNCTDVLVTPVLIQQSLEYFRVQCTLSAGQGADLYVRMQYCVQPNAVQNNESDVDCSRWNWAWDGTSTGAGLDARWANSGVRISYPLHYFIPSSLHAVTLIGAGQRTSDYVSLTSLGEDVGFDVENLFLERAGLVRMMYGAGNTHDDYPYECIFNQELSFIRSPDQRTIVCRTKDAVNVINLKFKLIIAYRAAYSTDTYSYPQLPSISSVFGCPSDDIVNGVTSGCPTDSGTVRLTVTGTGFLEPLQAMVGGFQCLTLVRESNTQFTCRLPVGCGSQLSLTVIAGSQRFESRGRINYAIPAISEIRGCQRSTALSIYGCNRHGGDRILLRGHNFGAFGSTVTIGGLPCRDLVHLAANPHQEIMCTAPADASVDHVVTVLQRYGELSQDKVLLSYAQCPPGQHSSNIECIPCAPGYFNDIWSQTRCRECQPGSYSDRYGAMSCSICPIGTYSGLGQTSCSLCPRGTFSRERAESCFQCAPGTFAEHEGSFECEACPLGAEHTNDYSFCHCKPGSYKNIDGVCQPCMPGGDCSLPGTSVYNILSMKSYAPSVTHRNPPSVVRAYFPVNVANNVSLSDASRSAQRLVIKALFDTGARPRSRFVFESVLDAFPANVSAVAVSPQAAVPAPSGRLTLYVMVDVLPPTSSLEPPAQELVNAALGDFNAQNSALAIETAFAGAPMVDRNYTRHAVLSFQTCLDSTCAGRNGCVEGHTGPLCSICLPGYGKTSVFKCGRCNDPALAWFIIIAGTLAAIIVCAVLAWKQIVDGRESMNELPAPAVPLLFKIAFSGLQVMAIASKYDLRWPGFLDAFFTGSDTAAGVGTAMVSVDCFLGDNPVISPFWVTCIGIMVLPIMGIILPLLFFMPLYYIAKRNYKKRVLSEMVEQRRLMVEIVTEFESNMRTRDRVAKAQHEAAASAHYLPEIETGALDTTNHDKNMCMVSGALTAHPQEAKPTNNASIDRNLCIKQNFGAQSVFVRDSAGKRRKLVRKSPINELSGNFTEAGPLAPPVQPPAPARDVRVDVTTQRFPRLTRCATSPNSNSTAVQKLGVSPGSQQQFYSSPPPVRNIRRADESPMRISYNAEGYRVRVSPMRVRPEMQDSRHVDAANPPTQLRSDSLQLVGSSFVVPPAFGLLHIDVGLTETPKRTQLSMAHSPRRAQTTRVRVSPMSGDSTSDADARHPFSYDPATPKLPSLKPQVMLPHGLIRTKPRAIVADEQAPVAVARALPAKSQSITDDMPIDSSYEEDPDSLIVFEHNNFFDDDSVCGGRASENDQDCNETTAAAEAVPPHLHDDSESPLFISRPLPMARKSPRDDRRPPLKSTDTSICDIDLADLNVTAPAPSAIDFTGAAVGDDTAFFMRRTLIDEVSVSEAALEHAYAMMNQSRESLFECVAREVDAYTAIVSDTPVFDAQKCKEATRKAKLPVDFARVVQSADDLENMRLLSSLPFDILYNAELLRENLLRRERKLQRVRAEQQRQWYVDNYGEMKGVILFTQLREMRLKADPPKLTASEMRVRLDIAETQYNNIISEFSGYVITTITVVMFLIHPNIARQFFTMLSCKNVGGSDDPSANVVLGDMLERCYSSQHLMFIIALAMPMLFCWVLGIPFFAWFAIYRNRNLVMMSVQGASAITRNLKKIFESQMAFLYRGYKPTRYYWFLIEMIRKAGLVAIAVFFPGALHTQLLLASLLIFVSILLQITLKPFENKIPEMIELLSLFMSFMVFFLANFLFVDTVSESAKTVITVLICVIVILFIVAVVVAFLMLRKQEAALVPLRNALREAHAQGLETAAVIREWRIVRARERRCAEATSLNVLVAKTTAPQEDDKFTPKNKQSEVSTQMPLHPYPRSPMAPSSTESNVFETEPESTEPTSALVKSLTLICEHAHESIAPQALVGLQSFDCDKNSASPGLGLGSGASASTCGTVDTGKVFSASYQNQTDTINTTQRGAILASAIDSGRDINTGLLPPTAAALQLSLENVAQRLIVDAQKQAEQALRFSESRDLELEL